MSSSAKIVLVVVLLVSGLVAQNPSSAQSRVATSSPTIVMPPPVVYIVPGGYGGYYTGYYGMGAGAYLVPTATLPVQSTGISLANTAGISLNGPLQTGAMTAVPAAATGAYGAPGYGAQGNGMAGSSVIGFPEAVTGSTAAPVETSLGGEGGRGIVDIGPSVFLGAGETQSATNVPSLGEVAAKNKARPKNVRMYTNEDAERIVRTVKTGSSGAQTPQQNVPR